ncbi:unnamed protein product [Calypogeia fissa]
MMAVCLSFNLQLPPLSQLLKLNHFMGHGLPLRVVQQLHSRTLLVPIQRVGTRLHTSSLPWIGSSPRMRAGAGHILTIKSFASDGAGAQSVQSQTRVLKRKARLDELCVEKFPQYSRTMIQSWILQGKVTVDGKAAFKAGTLVPRISNINITAKVPKFVCRAGYKLEAAIDYFECDITDKVALDAGLSTGGFTDCLLQRGAAFVYGVDVGYGQVAEKIRQDKRVCVMERTNLRYLAELPQLVDLVTLDLAFISILVVMPAVLAVMKPHSTLITLIKPQFEASRSQVGGGGVVRDPEVHKEVVSKVINGVEACGFKCKGWIQSPLKGAEGNIEFLACFTR